MKPQKARYPLREYFGKYSQWVLVLKGSSSFRIQDKNLERFFAMFPKKNSVDDFTSIDIADYVAFRLKNKIAERTLYFEINTLRQFFKWATEHAGVVMHNPVRAYKMSTPYTRNRLKVNISLEEVTRLLAECPSDVERRIILNVLAGGKCPSTIATTRIKEAAVRAGIVGFGLGILKSTVRRRLDKEIIKAYCETVLATPPSPRT
jgi:site-specific recombinase XerD